MRAALKETNHSANEPLTEKVALEVCQHAEGKVLVTGSIGTIAKTYTLGLKAVDCTTRNVLAEAEEYPPDKQSVLKALNEAAIVTRKRMGEPLSSVRRYATPLDEATTSSLEAWKSYSLGVKASYEQGVEAALPFYKRAVEIDPKFVRAYVALSFAYANRAELERSQENARKAYELRETVGERERLAIESTYYMRITGEMDKAAQVYEQWRQVIPRMSRLGGTWVSSIATLEIWKRRWI